MAFVDELEIRARAGRGGDGVVRFRREKFKEFGGPSGGAGGRGGDVIVRATSDIEALGRLAGRALFAAGDGEPGMSHERHGRSGKDCVIDVPVGSIVTDLTSHEVYDLLECGQSIVVLRGGRGGLGNTHFKSAVNRAPRRSTRGSRGDEATLRIELRLIADVGIVGLPNAGKSSLLRALTAATPKIGSYEFTTIDPNLGALDGFVIADLPGLIEGASLGKGLGHKFLRHISRTSLLLHCISLTRDDIERDYQVVRAELSSFNGLSEKPEIIILTKSDSVDSRQTQEAMRDMTRHAPDIWLSSVHSSEMIARIRENLLSRIPYRVDSVNRPGNAA